MNLRRAAKITLKKHLNHHGLHMTKQWKPFKHAPNAQESKILKSNATTGNPSVL